MVWIKILLVTGSLSLTSWISIPGLQSSSYIFLVTVAAFFVGWIAFRKQFPTLQTIFHQLNRQWDHLEYSTELLALHPENDLKTLQQRKILDEINKSGQFHYPIQWTFPLLLFALAILTTLGIPFLQSNSEESLNLVPALQEQNKGLIQTQKDSVVLSQFRIQIEPPSYTRREKFYSTNPDLNLPVDSRVTWQLAFDGVPEHVWLSFTSGDSLSLKLLKSGWTCATIAQENGLYTINFKDAKGSFVESPYYQFSLIPDNPPEIAVRDLPAFQRIPFMENIDLELNATLSDDYGLTDSYVVATITKGSGESVKFREEKIPFSKTISGRNDNGSVILNTSALGMEPGNELYFYVIAFDNREPLSQSTKTETFFFILEDTAEVEFSLQGNLGVDIMPDYFRSQLQLIIDTKKLIEKKESIPKQEFNQESNALGFDQKQLRLKYGQFIGEEEDSGLEINDEEPEPQNIGTDGENVLDEFGHDTDHENEEGQLMDKGTWVVDDHHHAPTIETGGETEEDPLEAFIHNHEDEETNTFLFQSIKDKLRAALNEMWDAELYLRLYRPHESLPYQYKALELLNEIKNHARIYVQRIGFDPPPINEDEGRLSRENDDPNSDPFFTTTELSSQYPAIVRILDVMSQILASKQTTNRYPAAFKEAGQQLAILVVDNPGMYLDELQSLKILESQTSFSKEDHLVMEQLLRQLPAVFDNQESISSEKRLADPLNQVFIRKLTERSR